MQVLSFYQSYSHSSKTLNQLKDRDKNLVKAISKETAKVARRHKTDTSKVVRQNPDKLSESLYRRGSISKKTRNKVQKASSTGEKNKIIDKAVPGALQDINSSLENSFDSVIISKVCINMS